MSHPGSQLGFTVAPLAQAMPDVLAVGAFLKSSICVIKGDRAFVSQSTDSLDNAPAIRRFEERIASMLAATGAVPVIVAHDLHPDFYSTRFAHSMGLPTLAVQHHHAHIAALQAERHVVGPIVGAALDGFGLGPNNESWGGEVLLADGPRFERLGHLAPMLQPGGDIAAREPWRMAAAFLHRLGRGDEVATRFNGLRGANLLARMMETGVNCPSTTSAGRLFDCACGLLGVHPVAELEGQAPMALESMTVEPQILADGWRIAKDNVLDMAPLLLRLLDCEPKTGAEIFHGTVTAALAEWIAHTAAAHGIEQVALGGGCFLNRILTDGLVRMLTERGLKPLTALRVSPGDAGLSLGQAWVAAMSVMAKK